MPEAVLIDSSIVIDDLRGVPAAHAYLTPLLDRRAAFLHPVGVAEILIGARNRSHLARLNAVIGLFRLVNAKNVDFLASLDLLRTHSLSHDVGWADCLIAASCIRLDLPIATLNVKHFRVFRGLRVVRPY
ncbi:MAG: PIN domain-containing protein [Phycisphaerales bacterium]